MRLEGWGEGFVKNSDREFKTGEEKNHLKTFLKN
jgi:hypothetical protein